jgi:uroporphyrin-III C-methyltransferase/precorrin-2 dehydrogenase/sirohydrochlorin ferrochelatase
MRHFPVFLNVQNKRILVTGAGECAIAKLRLLLKTEAEIIVFATSIDTQVETWEKAGLLKVIRRKIQMHDMYNTAMLYAAEDDEELDGETAAKAKMANVLFNIVDNLQESEFITPALVDRDPVTIAIGTEGTAPILARKIKAQIEESLPVEIGLLAKLAEYFRPKASRLPMGRTRRKFWSRYFYDHGPSALREGGKRGVARTLNRLFAEAKQQEDEVGRVYLVGSGPGDPDLLTRKALKVLHEADVVIHDRLVAPEILELARREADIIQTGKQGFGASWKQEDINALMIEHAQKGAQVVRLKSGDPAVFARLDEEMDALDLAGIEFDIIPGITTASAAAASLNVSLTKRNRNSALQIMTAQDIKGFAEQDWRRLSASGSVAAIYMGFKSAHLLSGRLLMHGASADTPVTVMENVSRANQKVLVTTIAELPKMADEAGNDGPVIMMLGLEPRQAQQALDQNRTALAQVGVQ